MKSPRQRPRTTSGFALLITITLLAFLVLLLVSLASLTRVEAQVATNGRHLASARQNALFALGVALGHLQKHAGPDQRVSGPSNLGTGAGTVAAGTVGRSDVQPHWVGIWRDKDPATPEREPELLTWLVSGNELGDPLAETPAVGEGYAPGDDHVLLIGPGTVVPPSAPSATTPETRIIARKMPIEVPVANVPGQGGSDPITVGNYSWWIGDEGIKARVNLRDPHVSATDEANKRHRLQSARRMGIEAITGWDTYPANSERLEKGFSLSQHRLADTDAAFTGERFRTRFHDVTAASAGVLADSRNGGLKRDLSWLLSRLQLDGVDGFRAELNAVLPGAAPGAVFNPIISTASTLHGASFPVEIQENSPTWEQLWSFHNIGNETTDTPAGAFSGDGVDARMHSWNAHGIVPVLYKARLFGGLRLDGSGRPYIHLKVLVVLVNPYAVPINAADYLISIGSQNGTPGFYLRRGTGTSEVRHNELLGARFPRFHVRSEFAAGEARVFTLRHNAPGVSGWDAGRLCYDWNAEGPGQEPGKIFPLENDWDAGAASIACYKTAGGWELTAEQMAELDTKPLVLKGVNAGSLRATMLLGATAAFSENTVLQYLYHYDVGIGGGVANGHTIASVDAPSLQALWTPGGGFALRWRDAHDSSINRNYVHEANLRSLVHHGGSGTSLNPSPFKLAYEATENRWSGNLFVSDDNQRDQWGLFTQSANGQSTVPPVVVDAYTNLLFDVPRPRHPLNSLGQLQHFNAAGHLKNLPTATSFNSRWNRQGFVPAYAIANSHASPFVERDSVATGAAAGAYYDASFLLNDVLWDRFTLSSFPSAGNFDFATDVLVNHRYKPFRADIATGNAQAYRADAYAAPRNLFVAGAFNVNSTSVEAWRALFASLRGTDLGTDSDLNAPFPRTLFQTAGADQSKTGVHANAWTGFRDLTDAELDALATAIVNEVKTRGPFLSLSDFVNRRLADDATGLRGALQAAIDAANINNGVTTAPFTNQGLSSGTGSPIADDAHRQPNLIAGFPGWLLQGDLLQPLAPVLGSRSDTFLIRAYGDTINPVTGDCEGRAWCEAVVQRLPDYVEPRNGTTGNDPEDGPALLSVTNANFGRKFVVSSFRWLTPEDI